jgi:hypothetical protein
VFLFPRLIMVLSVMISTCWEKWVKKPGTKSFSN